MVFKKESVMERLKKLEGVLVKLKEREGIAIEKYCQDSDVQWIIERGLEIGSSTILDIGNHILSGVYQTTVEEYEQILRKLREKQVNSSICPTKAMLDGAFELDKAYISTRYPDAHPTGSPSGRYIQGEARRLIQHAENIIRLCEGLLSKTDQS